MKNWWMKLVVTIEVRKAARRRRSSGFVVCRKNALSPIDVGLARVM